MWYKKTKEKSKTKSKGKPDLVKKLDRIFSLYIRQRDSKDGMFQCISCGKIKPIEQADCGHFFSRTHISTRYDEENCSAECSYCNRFRSDHLFDYQINLIKKIGKQRFDMLSFRAKQTKHWSSFELEELIKYYKSKIKK